MYAFFHPGKPNPPSFLNVIRDIISSYFIYRLNWSLPSKPFQDLVTHYLVEVYIGGINPTLCSCSIAAGEGKVAYFNSAILYYDKPLCFRVAAATNYGQSDFATYGCTAGTSTFSHLSEFNHF